MSEKNSGGPTAKDAEQSKQSFSKKVFRAFTTTSRSGGGTSWTVERTRMARSMGWRSCARRRRTPFVTGSSCQGKTPASSGSKRSRREDEESIGESQIDSEPSPGKRRRKSWTKKHIVESDFEDELSQHRSPKGKQREERRSDVESSHDSKTDPSLQLIEAALPPNAAGADYDNEENEPENNMGDD